jgi:hypothetical protein
MDRDLLGHAVRRSARRAGDVGAVAVAVVSAVPISNEIGAVAHPAGELRVFGNHRPIIGRRMRRPASRLPRHGYLLDKGRFKTIDFPGEPTQALGLNDRGQVVGGTINFAAGRLSGFLLDKGVYTRFDFPGALGTNALDINNRGQIAGIYADAARKIHAFLREENGAYTTIDVPGASLTFPFGINNRGHVVGLYAAAGVLVVTQDLSAGVDLER